MREKEDILNALVDEKIDQAKELSPKNGPANTERPADH